jgi:hypothetical protein
MAFIDNLLDSVEVVERRNSYLKAVCPTCKNESLKINISPSSVGYGAYKCWSAGCDPADIRKALNLNYVESTLDLSPSSIFKKSDIFRPSKSLKVDLVNNPNNFNGSQLGLIDPSLYQYRQTKVVLGSQVIKRTVYSYNPYLRILRIDRSPTKKDIYIQSWDSDAGWIAGTGDKIWPTFGINQKLLNHKEADSVVFVEGEKAAHFLQKQGIATFTFASHCFYGSPKDSAVTIFRYFFPQIRNIIYIPDLDEAGSSKEAQVRDAFQKVGMGYSDLRLDQLFGFDPNSSMDVADLSPLQIENLKNDLTRHTDSNKSVSG